MDSPLVVETSTAVEQSPGAGTIRETAWAHTDALVGIFSCTADEMRASLVRSRPDSSLVEPARSWVHEHQHLYHAISTPIGVFCNAMRDAQSLATRDVLILLRSAGVPVKVPLLRQVRTANPTVTASVREPLTVWLDAELFLTYLQGSAAAYESLLAQNPVTKGVTISALFQRLQWGVARYLLPQGGIGIHQDLLDRLAHEELVDPAAWREEDRNSFTSSILAAVAGDRFWWLPTVLESACQAVEMWGQDFQSFERLYAARHLDLNYLWPITATASTLGSRSLPEILATHLAVCDLALAAPIMPDQVTIRQGLKADEMLPHLRFFHILGALQTVGALRGPDNYSAFTDAICEQLHWVRPEEVFAARDLGGSLRLGVRGEIFRLAAEYRRAMPAVFITPFAAYDAHMGTDFSRQFTFHTFQFADRVVHHQNKVWLWASQLNFICNEWLHGVMTGTPRTVVLPWRADLDELPFLTEEAQRIVSSTLGWEVPPPRIERPHE